jgi:hypothetical protein
MIQKLSTFLETVYVRCGIADTQADSSFQKLDNNVKEGNPQFLPMITTRFL